ncbi:MAG: phenylalanine--tRNA ligase subunit beta [Armatimonadota bacterium]
MLVPVEWLREYTDFDLNPAELADRLTMSGLEVEEISEESGQVVFSTYVTPNRPDLLSITGVARDISALLDADFRYPTVCVDENGPVVETLAGVRIDTPVNCPRYSARVIQNVKITASPKWMQDRLVAAGMRPINNVVDATNYVLLEMGQPLHAFDYDLIAGHQIIVRQAEQGEKITTIDGEERELNPNMMVIADTKRAVALAGIMGGYDSEVSSRTKNVLIESAHFNRLSIRKTARALQMGTEASFRYERNVDPALTVIALDRVTQLITQTSGGSVAKGIIDEYPVKHEPVCLEIRPDRSNMMLGFNLSADQIAHYLSKLGMGVDCSCGIKVTVPTFRPDIQHEEDLIEEVGRIYGYECIPSTLPVGKTMQGRDNEQNKLKFRISDILISAGMQEVVTGSMVASVTNDNQIVIRNPLNDELNRLRDNLLLDLINIIAYNNSRGTKDTALFQIGHIFVPSAETFEEKLSIAGAITGNMWGAAWNIDKSQLAVDFFMCKGIVESLLDRLGIVNVRYKAVARNRFHPGRTAVIEADDMQLGIIGEISAETSHEYDLPGRVCAFELDFNTVMALSGKSEKFAPLSKYPAITRDLAVVVPLETPCELIIDLLMSGSDNLLESLSLFDIYTGKPLLDGQKSMAFKAAFRSKDRTLRDEDVEARLLNMKDKLAKSLGATFRDA